MKGFGTIVLIIICFFGLFLFKEQSVDAKTSVKNYIIDYQGILDENTKRKLNSTLSKISQENKVDIMININKNPSLGDKDLYLSVERKKEGIGDNNILIGIYPEQYEMINIVRSGTMKRIISDLMVESIKKVWKNNDVVTAIEQTILLLEPEVQKNTIGGMISQKLIEWGDNICSIMGKENYVSSFFIKADKDFIY